VRVHTRAVYVHSSGLTCSRLAACVIGYAVCSTERTFYHEGRFVGRAALRRAYDAANTAGAVCTRLQLYYNTAGCAVRPLPNFLSSSAMRERAP